MDSQQESPTDEPYDIWSDPGRPQRPTKMLPYTASDAYIEKSMEYARKREAAVVYFLRCGNFVKIGYSYDPRKRIEKIQIWSPHDCELMGIAAGGPALEKTLHKEFSADRHRGEWFRLTDRLLAEIQRLCEPPISSV
jgi:hypothetical protein